MNDLEEIIYKHALLNAAKHKGSANPGAVIGSMMSQEPDLRKKGKEIGSMAGKIVAQVNNLSKEEQASEMEKYDDLVELLDMKIYSEDVLRESLEKTGFKDFKAFVDEENDWICITAIKI